MRSRAADAAAQRLRPAFAVASLLLILLLGVFAYALARSQSQQREDLENRFEDRAKVAATVNDALFSFASSSTKQNDAKTFGGATVDQKALDQRTAVQQQNYAAIVSSDGKVLAKSGTVPAGIATDPQVKKALASKQVVYSSLMSGPGGKVTIQSAAAFPAIGGQRVDISSGSADAFGQFLNSFLTRLPSVAHARSYVIDGANKIIATPGAKTQAGVKLPDEELAAAVAKKAQGTYDGKRYFASYPIES